MKINELESTQVSYTSIVESKLFQECRDMAPQLNRQWRTLNEGKALNAGEIHSLFTGIEQTMTAGGNNKTLMGKGADAFGWLGGKINGVKQALKDTTPVQGLDKMFADLKNKASGQLEKSPGGAEVLRKIDQYQQWAKKYPKTQAALWNSAAIIGGLLTGGAAVPLILGTAKTLDSMVLGKELSTSIGAGVGQMGKTAAVASASAGIDAIANTDIPDFGPDVDPNVTPPGPNDVTPGVDPNASQEFPLQNDPNAPNTGPTDNPPSPDNVTPPVKPAPVKPTPVKPTPGVDSTIDPYNPSTDTSLDAGRGELADKPFDATFNGKAYNPDDPTGTTGDTGDSSTPVDDRAARAMASKSAPTSPPDYSMGVKGMNQNMANVGGAAKALPVNGGGKFTMEAAGKKISEQRLIESSIAAIGFTFTRLPKSVMIDKDDTVRHWALSESLGRTRSQSVRLTEDGVNAIFYNIDKLHGAILNEKRRNNYGREAKNELGTTAGKQGKTAQQFAADNPVAASAIELGNPRAGRPYYASSDPENQKGGTVYNRPADGNDAAAQAKQGNPDNTSSTAGPAGKLPGGNVGGLATGTAPAGNKMDYLAADPEGVYDTKHKGGVGGKTMDTIEKGIGRAGNYLSGLWKSATTKFEAERAKRRWKDEDSPTDSDEVAEFLKRQKVPPEIIAQVYQQLGFPAPKGLGQEAGGDWTNAAANPWTRGIAKGMGATDTVAAIDAGEPSNIGKGGKEKAGATTSADSEESTGAEEIAQQSGSNAREQKIARSIDRDIDDLIANLRKTDNILQGGYVNYIRERLDQTFGPAKAAAAPAAAAPAAATDAAAAPVAKDAAPATGMTINAPTGIPSPNAGIPKGATNTAGTSDMEQLAQAVDTVKESTSVKFTRKFAKFLDEQG